MDLQAGQPQNLDPGLVDLKHIEGQRWASNHDSRYEL